MLLGMNAELNFQLRLTLINLNINLERLITKVLDGGLTNREKWFYGLQSNYQYSKSNEKKAITLLHITFRSHISVKSLLASVNQVRVPVNASATF